MTQQEKLLDAGPTSPLKNDEAQQAKQKRIFDRVFQTEITDRFYDELIVYVDHQVEREKLATVTYSIDEAPEI